MGEQMRALLRVGPGPVDLAGIDPRGTPGVPGGEGKAWARAELAALGPELARQQEMLYATAKVAAPSPSALLPPRGSLRPRTRRPAGTAAARRRVLLVLQGMDCAGKGGTVRNVAGLMNPVGVRVVGFGAPTDAERAHHFLWRIKRALPPYGRIGVFDRSHYEDVLIARVRSLVPASVWRARYDEINRWEAELVGDGTAVVKVMLHLSYREQTQRLAARLADPTKHWKYHPGDLDERMLWPDYQAAYEEALARCGTDAAPWYVVPADRKWYRSWAVARLLLAAFDDLALAYPPAGFDVTAERHRLANSDRPVG